MTNRNDVYPYNKYNPCDEPIMRLRKMIYGETAFELKKRINDRYKLSNLIFDSQTGKIPRFYYRQQSTLGINYAKDFWHNYTSTNKAASLPPVPSGSSFNPDINPQEAEEWENDQQERESNNSSRRNSITNENKPQIKPINDPNIDPFKEGGKGKGKIGVKISSSND